MVCRKCGYQNRDGVNFCVACGMKLTESNSRSMRKGKILRRTAIVCAVLVVAGILSYLTIHSWVDATCTEPQKCKICGRIRGEALGHQWQEASCTQPRKCEICGESRGKAVEHCWQEATCTDAKRCITCGESSGTALGHQWQEATCTDAKYCITCGESSGTALDHDWIDATYEKPKTCARCGKREGDRLGELGDMQEIWSESPISLNNWNVYSLIMPQPIINCDYFVLNVEFGEYDEHPEIYDVVWDVYVKTLDGEWVMIMTLPVDGPEIWWPFESQWTGTGEPISFTELVMLPENATFTSYGFPYRVQDVHVTG